MKTRIIIKLSRPWILGDIVDDRDERKLAFIRKNYMIQEAEVDVGQINNRVGLIAN